MSPSWQVKGSSDALTRQGSGVSHRHHPVKGGRSALWRR